MTSASQRFDASVEFQVDTLSSAAPPQKAPIGVLATLAMTTSCGIVDAKHRWKRHGVAAARVVVRCSARMAAVESCYCESGSGKVWEVLAD